MRTSVLSSAITCLLTFLVLSVAADAQMLTDHVSPYRNYGNQYMTQAGFSHGNVPLPANLPSSYVQQDRFAAVPTDMQPGSPAPGPQSIFEPAIQAPGNTDMLMAPAYQPDIAATGIDTMLGSRIQSLESQLAAMQQNIGGLHNGNPCAHIGQSCYCDMPQQRDNCCTGLYGGVAAVWMKPHFKEAFRVSSTGLQSGLRTLIPFEYDYEATPRAFIGFRNSDCIGLKATYWEFESNGMDGQFQADPTTIYGAHVVSIIFPANVFATAPGDVLATEDYLETRIFNLYGTYDGCFRNIKFSIGAGLRYAELTQGFQASVNNPAALAPSSFMQWEREFSGLGPSLSFDGSQRIKGTCFSFFGTGGGALMFGEKTLNRSVFNDQSPQPAAPFLTLREADEVVGVGEMGIGVEWAQNLAYGNKMRVRFSYEGQLWAESGAPTLGFLGFEGFGVQVDLNR